MEFEFYNYESTLSKLTEVGSSVCVLYEEQWLHGSKIVVLLIWQVQQ